VKAPFSCPNSSLCSSVSCSAAHSTTTNGLVRRLLRAWSSFRAGLARDQDGGIGRRHTIDQREHAPELRTLADECAAEIGRREPALEQRRAAMQRLPLARPLNPDLDLVERARLGDVVEGAGFDRVDGRVDRSVAGEQNHFRRRQPLAHFLEHLEAAHVRQPQVEQHHFGLDRTRGANGFAAGAGDLHFVVAPFELARQRPAECGVVVDEQQAAAGGHADTRSSAWIVWGIRTSKVEPAPRSLVR
jgi:hypothetical protein